MQQHQPKFNLAATAVDILLPTPPGNSAENTPTLHALEPKFQVAAHSSRSLFIILCRQHSTDIAAMSIKCAGCGEKEASRLECPSCKK